MSFAHTATVFNIESLTSTAKLILSVVGDHANKYGQCWPSVATIARRASLTRRTVQRHLAALLERGLLSRLIRKGRSSFFTLNLTPTCATMAHPPAPQRRPEPVIESIKEITAASQIEAPTADAARVVDFEFQELPEVRTTVISEIAVPLRSMPTASNPTAAPLPELIDVPTELIEDFGQVRQTKKRGPKLTRTEARALKAEADKAGFTVAQAIMTCVLRGWSHFKAEWVPAPVVVPETFGTTFTAPETLGTEPTRTESAKRTGLAALAALRARMRPADAVTALPEPVADAVAPTVAAPVAPLIGPMWAVNIVNRKRAGQHVAHGPLDMACKALGLTVAGCCS